MDIHYRILFLVPVISCRHINLKRPPLPCLLGVVVHKADVSMRNILYFKKFGVRLGNLKRTGHHAASIERFAHRISKTCSVHFKEIVMESWHKRWSSHFPKAALILLHRIFHRTYIRHDILRAIRPYGEGHASVRIDSPVCRSRTPAHLRRPGIIKKTYHSFQILL